MKVFILATLSLMSFSALAQTTAIDTRIEKRLERLNDLVLRERAHVYLSEAQKKDVLQNINLAISAIRADQGEPTPNPNPYPNPNPNPYPTPVPQRITVEGKIESTNFRFEAPTMGAIFNQCSDFVRTRFSNADEMMVSFNGRAYIRQTTSSYWYGADAICNQIYNLATPQNLAPETYQPLMLEGYIETLKVEFSGSTYGEVFNKCVRHVESRLSNADEMEISVNGDRRFRTTTSSYWYGAHAICQTVMKNVPRI